MLAHPPFVGGLGTFAARNNGLLKRRMRTFGVDSQANLTLNVRNYAMSDSRLATTGDRIAALHKGMSRAKFARFLGIPDTSLGNYERNERKPDIEFLAILRRKTNANINWIATGEGEMYDAETVVEPATVSTRPSFTDPDLLERLSDRVAAAFRDVGQKPPQRRITREAAALYNELAKAVSDLGDREMVEVTLPRLELELRRRLEQAAESPGTGKRSAS